MQSPAQRIRQMLDKLRKQEASRPAMPKVQETRTLEELLGTGAAARNAAESRIKKVKPMRTLSLSDLQKRIK